MTPNEKLIHDFYTAFQNKDFKTMQNLYHDNAVFNDAIFKNLNASQVKAMWEMLIKAGKDMTVTYKNVTTDKENGSAEWNATYTFSRSEKKVVNRVKAGFSFKDGKIIAHTDNFDFYTWAKQALGFSGFLLGWTSLIKNKIQSTAKTNLDHFMNKADK